MAKIRRSVPEILYSALTDENGKPKSTLLLYSFCLSLLFFILCFLTSSLAIRFVGTFFSDVYPATANVISFFLCALFFVLISCCFWFIVRDQKIIFLLGYIFFFAATLVLFVCCLIKLSGETREEMMVFLIYYLAVLMVPSLIGTLISFVMYLRWNKERRV